jgi:hypothetical protein
VTTKFHQQTAAKKTAPDAMRPKLEILTAQHLTAAGKASVAGLDGVAPRREGQNLDAKVRARRAGVDVFAKRLLVPVHLPALYVG